MNKPLYKIGDRIPNTKFEVCGVMTTSKGVVRYWLCVLDNCFALDEDDLESAIAIANGDKRNYG